MLKLDQQLDYLKGSMLQKSDDVHLTDVGSLIA